MERGFIMRLASHLVLTKMILVLFSIICFPAWTVASDQLPVAVSILPLVDFTRNVGGHRIDITLLVPAGSSPHTYEPTPARARAIAHASVVILNGVGLEFWADKLIEASGNSDLIVVKTADGLEIIDDEMDHEDHTGEGHGLSRHHEKGNPHVWLDPINAIHQVERIRDALIQADPAGAEIYRTNATQYVAQLRELDGRIREKVDGLPNKKFISFHAAYSYLARRYGLEEAAVVARTPGREPSPREIAAIVKTAREVNVKVIFAEPQFPPKAAQVIAEECGAEVLFINPLGDPPDFVYLDTMEKNLHQLARALGGNT
jgi:ABC-type Zn uptake system ZnuABC Zn-binding protein ZnuA